MILESVVTTLNEDGSVHLVPMGPHVDSDFRRFELRPFKTSRTFGNLIRDRCGVIHVVDDVLLIARSLCPDFNVEEYEFTTATQIHGNVLSSCCRWYEIQVKHEETSTQRANLGCDVVASGKLKDFFGFNRAKNSVLEAAILFTRTEFIPFRVIEQEFSRLKEIIEKTGGPDELEAFALLKNNLELNSGN